jgi:hypothetical protein
MHVLVFVFPTVWFIVGSFLLLINTTQHRKLKRWETVTPTKQGDREVWVVIVSYETPGMLLMHSRCFWHHYVQTNTSNIDKTWYPPTKKREVKTYRTSLLCRNRSWHHNMELRSQRHIKTKWRTRTHHLKRENSRDTENIEHNTQNEKHGPQKTAAFRQRD